MNVLIHRLFVYGIGMVLIFLFTGPLIYGFHHLLFNPNDYITYSTPTIRFAKYFVLGMLLCYIGFRHVQLTKGGKVFFTGILVVSIIGFFTTTLWYNATNEKEIVKFRVVYSMSYSWDEVESVSTHVYRGDGRRAFSGVYSKPNKVIKEYNLHLTDGTVLNVWSDLDSMVVLHSFVLEQDLFVEHLTDAEYFDFRFKNYFNEDLEDAYFVFGVK